MTVYHHSEVDRAELRAYRLARVRSELKRRDYAGILLYDPVNIRYATDCANMQVWTLHNRVRFAFIATEGPVVLFDFHGSAHLAAAIETIDEVRPARAYDHFEAGPRAAEQAGHWAAEIADLLASHGGGNRRLAVDRLEPRGLSALQAQRVEVMDGDEVMASARLIKGAAELAAMREAIAACEEGMRRMRTALRPGISENALWSILHQTNIELGGEWIETRLLTSGPRTLPWFQECGPRRIEAGDLVSFDTDLIGPNGYCADISRSWLRGAGRPSPAQAELHEIALAQIAHNMALLQPGLSFAEFVERGYRLPEDCLPHRYSVLAHGVGLCDEYPALYYAEDMAAFGYDGILEAGMTLCVESLVGRRGGREAVKLEQQVLLGERGAEPLSTFPLGL